MLYKVKLTKTARILKQTHQAGSTVEVDYETLASLQHHRAITGDIEEIETNVIDALFEEVEEVKELPEDKPKRTRKAKAKATEGEDVE